LFEQSCGDVAELDVAGRGEAMTNHMRASPFIYGTPNGCRGHAYNNGEQ
jgi:hypothetical protein